MARLSIVFLIFVHSFMILAVVSQANVAQSSSSSSTSKIQNWPQAQSSRKLGKHNVKLVKFYADAPHLSPSESPQVKDKHLHSNSEISRSPQSEVTEEIQLNKQNYNDGQGNNSAAGGEVQERFEVDIKMLPEQIDTSTYMPS
ncbi:hypothetical protein POM88_047919 [Heracleum sosnowskyi]|uniref:Uncharacterized protein n=1 Tax=Heracleum sosnowskyi TaxID=360622 RepID=A0AAD8M033_9APIA|nr:hypothetical protein POM88_047919 [Heracleum sosnowskyi]